MDGACQAIGPSRPVPPLARMPLASRRVESYRGLDALAHGALLIPARWRRRAGRYLDAARRAAALEPVFTTLSDEALREEAALLAGVFRRVRDRVGDRERAAALIRECARRELGQRAFDVQIAGALAIHDGCVAEMATGEGKTLVAVFAAAMAGWRGRGCHVVTANDYLAARDAAWMRPVYEALALTVGHVVQSSAESDRRSAYGAAVTYTTNKELAADYLRDRVGAREGRAPMLRPLEHAIVDEADFVLIDDAATPLILSAEEPNDELTEAYTRAAAVAEPMRAGEHYRADYRHRECTLTAAGRSAAERATEAWGGVWASTRRREELVTQALEAREFFVRGREFVVQAGKVVIVDEARGRLMPDRTWREGVHQAVEARAGVPVSPLKSVQARISFQRLFRMYRRLGGMTGTAREARGELWGVYRLPVVAIPTNRACIRRTERARIVATREQKWRAVAERAGALAQAGRPVLIGTPSVAESEAVSRALTAAGLEHSVLNAERHAEEAEIVARAGESGRVTVATNMAGRGTDIRLDEQSKAAGGLAVIATARHESARIDRQLAGRAARQGDPGGSITILSQEDDLLKRSADPVSRRLQHLWPRAAFALAQRSSERAARRRRRDLLLHDDWLAEFLGFAGAE